MSWYQQLLTTIDQMEWPQSDSLTPKALEAYETGIDMVDGYRGEPEHILLALRWFRDTESRPLAYAGIAYALMAASYIQARKYDPKGLTAAEIW